MLTFTVRRLDFRVNRGVPRNLPFGDQRKVSLWLFVQCPTSPFRAPPPPPAVIFQHSQSGMFRTSLCVAVSAFGALVLFPKDFIKNLSSEAIPQ